MNNLIINSSTKTTNNLFIEHVFLEDLFDNNTKSNEILNKNEDNFYKKIPNKFTDKLFWLKHTNINCWYCSCIFSNTPVFIPKNIEYDNNDILFYKTYGCFCSFNCCISYINLKYPISGDLHNNVYKKQMLYKLYTNFYPDKKITEILPSPERNLLKKFGGHLTDEEYQNKIAFIKNIE
tara:strand:+ start:647 stop:1183 length:537 start_codon:yes stop_codon:yes gene_type:complete